MNKKILYLSIVSLFVFASCKKDKDDVAAPVNPNETELITTVKLIFAPLSDLTDTTSFSFRDLDGPGGSAPLTDTIRLSPDTDYNMIVVVLDETKHPADTTSNEIEEEHNVHQFFYSKTGTYVLTTTYQDADDHGVPVGLQMNVETGAAFTEKTNGFRIILKHQPGLKPVSGQGDSSLGETDVDVIFPILVR